MRAIKPLQELMQRRELGQATGIPEEGSPWPELDPFDVPQSPNAGHIDPGFVAPGPSDLKPERWDLDQCQYTIALGDTYVGLAKTYLEPSGARWREVWEPNRGVTPDPDALYPGQVIVMPDEACANMRAWVGAGGPPGTNPSEVSPPRSAKKKSNAGAFAIAAAVAALAFYAMS